MIPYKTLAFAVIIGLAISLVGVFASLWMIQQVRPYEAHSIGRATTADGEMSIEVRGGLSITADDNIINFSGCRPNATVYSNVLYGNGVNACADFMPDGFIVRNDGSQPANVTVNFTNRGAANGGTFLLSPSMSSWAAYKTSNTSTIQGYAGGCGGLMPLVYTNITQNTQYRICDNLHPGSTYNSIRIDVGFFIPADMSEGTEELSLVFFAYGIA